MKRIAMLLYDATGFARFSGADESGNRWIQFEVDYMAEQEEKADTAKLQEVIRDGKAIVARIEAKVKGGK